MKTIALSLFLMLYSSIPTPNLFIERFIQRYQEINAKRMSQSIIYVPRIDNLVLVESEEIYSPRYTIEQRRRLVLENIFNEKVTMCDCQYAINLCAGRFYEYSITLSGNSGRSVWLDMTDTKYESSAKRISALMAILIDSPPDYVFTVNRFEQYSNSPFWIIIDDEVFVLLYDDEKGKYDKVDPETFIMRIAEDYCFFLL